MGTVTQAEERLRAAQQKYDNGFTKHLDVLEAEFALLKADLQISAAEFRRAAALEKTD